MAIYDNHLVEHSDSLLELNTPNTRRGAFRQLFYVFALASFIFDTIFMLSGHSFLEMFYAEYDMAIFAWVFNLPALLTFILWRTTKPSRVFFDRRKKAIRLVSGSTDLHFPWESIRFDVHWIPTKLGGINYLALKAGPPFPEAIARKSAKKLAKIDPEKLFVGLGGFDCKNQSVADAYIHFFSGLMTTDISSDELYRSTVGHVKTR